MQEPAGGREGGVAWLGVRIKGGKIFFQFIFSIFLKFNIARAYQGPLTEAWGGRGMAGGVT